MADRTVFQPAPQGVPPGTRLNGVYEIERLIGEGGMGEVYKGFNIQTGDPVAIKMVLPAMSRNPDVLALFRREASTLHHLQHEAIVRYFVFSVDPELQRAYLAMEYVDGPSLATRLSEGPLSSAEVGVLFNRIAPALDEAHRLGVVHRDISSDNFILPDGDVRKAKLIDFGIARSRRPNEGTIIGDGFAGKYKYVSPEQLGLAGGEVTGQSDVYSFGLVLAEALRGRPLDMGGSQVEVIEKRRRVPDLFDVAPSFRPLLESMLQPNPADRPAKLTSLAAFEVAGRAFPPVAAKPTGRRGGGLMFAVALTLIVASLGALGYLFRDAATDWIKGAPAPLVTETPKPPKLPPLGGEPPTPSPSASSATVVPTPTPTPSPTPSATQTPGLPELLDELPPRAPQALVSLPAGTVGAPYQASLPAFADPGHKGLVLRADTPPDGLSFTDKGDGSGELSGAPSKPGATTFVVTATNHKGRNAKLSASIVVAAAPAPASPKPSPSAPPPQPIPPLQTEVSLPEAMVGRDYDAMLPPFSVPPGSSGVSLHAAPHPPEGLTLIDAGNGFSRLSGAPTHSGAYDFEIVASDARGGSGKMSVKLIVAPAPILPTQPSVTLEDAVAGREYDATLPSFRVGPDSVGFALHAEPEIPAGLTLTDAGGGVGRLSGKPNRTGAYHFDIVATDARGASGRMSADLNVAPAPAPVAPSQAGVIMEEAVVGRDYSAAVTWFQSAPNAKSLTLRAEPSPPDGLTFADAGAGVGRLSGKPKQEGAYRFDVVATDANGASGRVSVGLVVAPAPIPPPHRITPSQTEVRLDDAVEGRDYNAALPPFRAVPDPNGLALRAEPNPPEGLTFSDEGGGFSQISGKPTRPGVSDFSIIAEDASGARGQMKVEVIVAPAPAPVETPTPDAGAKAQAMLAKYSDGACFFARQRDASVEAVGSERSAFPRLEAAFKREVGAEPDIAAKLIVPAQCPAVSLMKLSLEGGTAAPTIDLSSFEVGAAHPLAGAVRGLAGRRLTLLAVDNDGDAHVLPSVGDASGDAATFSVPLSGDAESIGPLQILLAIASNGPFVALDHYRPGPVGDLAGRLRADWSKLGAAADAAFFKLTK